eukprot:TRINITY_DN3942_c0_g1_i1.p1 TRINITY_DN3942_c0_g1~~TRINITY_DN3942_c0_g1_i1.p1  ORF type:complete len:164 (-),score=28.91 TRINITY_DN3942_c0_g1_i1:320-811(-)
MLYLFCFNLMLLFFFFFQMIRRPPRSTHCISSAASDVYKRQLLMNIQHMMRQKKKIIIIIANKTKTNQMNNLEFNIFYFFFQHILIPNYRQHLENMPIYIYICSQMYLTKEQNSHQAFLAGLFGLLPFYPLAILVLTLFILFPSSTNNVSIGNDSGSKQYLII